MVFYALPAFSDGDRDGFLRAVGRVKHTIKKVGMTKAKFCAMELTFFSFCM